MSTKPTSDTPHTDGLPPNTRELLLGLHAEFYSGPLVHADAFRILPRVADALERRERDLTAAQSQMTALRGALDELWEQTGAVDGDSVQYMTRQKVLALLAASPCPLTGLAKESYMAKVNAEADTAKLIRHANFILQNCDAMSNETTSDTVSGTEYRRLKRELADERELLTSLSLASRAFTRDPRNVTASEALMARQSEALLSLENRQIRAQLTDVQKSAEEWKLCAETTDRKMLHEQADHNKTVDKLLALRAELASSNAQVTEVKEQLNLMNTLRASEKQAKVERGDMLCECESQLTAAQSQVTALTKALKAYRLAYTPDGHSKPHDCFATGPLTGDAIADFVSCPGCSAQALGDAALAAPSGSSSPAPDKSGQTAAQSSQAECGAMGACPKCWTSLVLTDGWVPSYNDPDNASGAPEAVPMCPKCQGAANEDTARLDWIIKKDAQIISDEGAGDGPSSWGISWPRGNRNDKAYNTVMLDGPHDLRAAIDAAIALSARTTPEATK